MSKKKNVIIFYTDQQRADTLGCMGNDQALTPNIDSIAERGTIHTNHYAVHTLCQPSRSSFITGVYPQVHGVLNNGYTLPENELTLPQILSENGYLTANVGKLHFQPFLKEDSNECIYDSCLDFYKEWNGPYYGFDKAKIVCGHGEKTTGHYGVWRQQEFPNYEPGSEHADDKDICVDLMLWDSAMPVKAHHSTYIKRQTIELLREYKREQPFMLHVSFPDPHHPFTPPEPYCSMYDNVDLPEPHKREGEHKDKPLIWRESMAGKMPYNGGGKHYEMMDEKIYKNIASHYYGMISLIDDCIGEIIDELEKMDLMEDTIIVFTSDHGEFLGDHHFLFKGYMPCRSLLHIPLIVYDPDKENGIQEAISSNLDVMSTILDSCGIEVPERVQGKKLASAGEDSNRDHVLVTLWSGGEPGYFSYTLYTEKWRISIYPYTEEGELYNLLKDPHELNNLYYNKDFEDIIEGLEKRLLDAVAKAEIKVTEEPVKF